MAIIRTTGGTDELKINSANAAHTTLYDSLGIEKGTVTNPVVVSSSGTQNVNVVSGIELEFKNDSGNPLPVSGSVSVKGVSTAANQTTANASLSSIDTKTPALGQALSAASTPVVLPVAQITALTPPTSVGITGSVAVTGTFFQATQPVSAAALPLPTGAATSANQTLELTALNSIVTNTGTASTDTIQTGTIVALNGTVVVNAQGTYTVTAAITGTFVATVVIEGQDASGAWNSLPMYLVTPSVPYSSQFSTTTTGVFVVTGGGYASIRARASAYTSGTINIAFNASLGQQTIASSQLGSWSVKDADTAFVVTTTSATGVAATLTIPAATNQFHFIDSLEITAYSTAARTGVVTPILVTSTNLSSMAWTFATAAVIGSTDRQLQFFPKGIKSTTVNTVTTIVAPATTGIIWRLTATYRLG